MAANTAFQPSGGTVSVGISAASASVTISKVYPVIEVQNDGGATCFIRWGVGAQTAADRDYPVLAGHAKTITIGTGNDTLAVIGTSGMLYVTSGEGL